MRLVVLCALATGCDLYFDHGPHDMSDHGRDPDMHLVPDAGHHTADCAANPDGREPDWTGPHDAPPADAAPPPYDAPPAPHDAPPAPPPPADAPPSPPPDAPPAPPPDAPVARKRVFITAAPYDASFADLASGDAHAAGDFLCAQAAGSVFAGGTWKVFLSTEDVAAIDRIADVGPWYRMTGDTVVFNNKANLYTLPLAYIDQHESGRTVLWGNHYAWTGTTVGGTAASSTCADWVSTSSAHHGVIGSAKSTTAGWVDIGTQACNARARLYCFEQ